MFRHARKRNANANRKAAAQLKAQKASLQRKQAQRKASGHYSAMELVALEAQKGVQYYNAARTTGKRDVCTTDWRDAYNASK